MKQAHSDISVAKSNVDAANTKLDSTKAFQTEAMAGVKSVQTLLKARNARLKLARDNLNRKTKLKKDGFATEERLFAAEIGLEAAEAEGVVVKSEVKAAVARLDATKAAHRETESQLIVRQAELRRAVEGVTQAESLVKQADVQVALMKSCVQGLEAQVKSSDAEG